MTLRSWHLERAGTITPTTSAGKCLAGAGPPAHEGASASYAPVGRYPFE